MPARRVRALVLLCLSVTFGSKYLPAQTGFTNNASRSSGVDQTTHRFHPAVSPESIALEAGGEPVKESATIGPTAAQQINSLLRDKQTRTAAQKKISSKLIYTTR